MEAIVAGFIIGTVCGVIMSIIFAAIISGWLKHVPEQYREITPGQVWLIIIPFFALYWQFRVYMTGVPNSFKNYFNAQGRTDVGDCGKSLGMWMCILTFLGFVPIINFFSGIAVLVLYVLWLVKIHGLKQQIVLSQQYQPPVGQG
jgi:hypothetical protein